jgi:hypothetical protein
VAIPADRDVTQKEEEEEKTKYETLCTDTTNVEHEMYDYTGNNRSHRNTNKRFKETVRTFSLFLVLIIVSFIYFVGAAIAQSV